MKKTKYLTAIATGFLISGIGFSQAPVRDDDINGKNTAFKSDLAAGTEAYFPLGDHSFTNAVDLIKENPKFTVLSRMLTETGLDKELKKKESITIFAPTDDAFGKMTEAEIAAMMTKDNRENLLRLLAFHVLPTKMKSSLLTDDIVADTLAEGAQLEIETRVDDGDVVIVVGNLAKLVSVDNETKNGIVHAIDRVMFPRLNKDEG